MVVGDVLKELLREDVPDSERDVGVGEQVGVGKVGVCGGEWDEVGVWVDEGEEDHVAVTVGVGRVQETEPVPVSVRVAGRVGVRETEKVDVGVSEWEAVRLAEDDGVEGVGV